MTSTPDKPRRRRRSAAAVFAASWVVVLALVLVLTGLGIGLAGSAGSFRDWLVTIAPYALVWRLVIYGLGAAVYIQRIRPRLRARQRRPADGGDAGRARLIKIERMLVVVLVVLELSNLPGLIHWIQR